MKPVDDIITEILQREGWPAYTNAPADRGGPTKGGITLKSWQEYAWSVGTPLPTAADLQAVTELEARAFYRQRYYYDPQFYRIEDPHLLELVVDAGVHHGPRHAAKWLQYAADVKQDGAIGDITIAAVNAADPRELYLWLVAFRLRLFGRLIGRDPELARARRAGFNLQARWAGGWNNRAADFIEALAVRLESQHHVQSGTAH